jgi:uncharacterized protein (TIGR03435 family)
LGISPSVLRALLAAYLSSGLARGQSNAQPLSFEAAEIKLNKSGRGGVPKILPSGEIEALNETLIQLIMGAYGVSDNRIIGGPAWRNKDRFDLIAKAAPNSTLDAIRKMMQTLLADRFKLVTHHEAAVMSTYVLKVGKKGARLQPAADPNADTKCKPGEGPKEQRHLVCQNWTIAHLAGQLPSIAPGDIKLPVTDLTGIKGSYDIRFDFMGNYNYNSAIAKGANPETDALMVSIFDAIGKFGLTLEKSGQPIDTIVIDSVEHPDTAN